MPRFLRFLVFALLTNLALISSAQSPVQDKLVLPNGTERKDVFGDSLPDGAIARIGTVRYRGVSVHHAIQDSMLSPDGKWVLVSPTGIELRDLKGWKRRPMGITEKWDEINRPYVTSFDFSSDGKYLAVCDSTLRQVLFLDIATGKSVKRLPVPGVQSLSSTGLRISQDQKTLVLSIGREPAPKGGLLLVWDLVKDRLKHVIHTKNREPDPDRPWLAIAPDGSQMVRSIHDPATLPLNREFWMEFLDLRTAKPIRKIATEGPVPRIIYSPDGTWLAATVLPRLHFNSQPVLRIYDTATGKERHNIRLRRSFPDPASYPQALAIAPDGQSLYLSEENFTRIGQWNPRTGERIGSYPVPMRVNAIQQFAFPKEGNVLALGSSSGALFLWDVKTGKTDTPVGVPCDRISEIRFSPQGELFVSSADDLLAWWDPRTGLKKRDQKVEWPADHVLDRLAVSQARWEFRDLLMAPHGELFATLGRYTVGVYDAKTGQLLYDETRNHDTFCFFKDGTRAASMQDHVLRCWDSRTGRDVAQFEIPMENKEGPRRLAVAPDGKQFALATWWETYDGRVRLWDFDQKKPVREWAWSSKGVSFSALLDFSPDNRWLAIRKEYGALLLARLGKAHGADCVLEERPGYYIQTIAFSADGRQLAYTKARPQDDGNPRAITLFELASKQVRREFIGHDDRRDISHLAYSPDAALLASGSSDTTVLVWQAGLRAFAESPMQGRVPEKQLELWFDQMAGSDAKVAFQGMIKLVQAPKQTVSLLERRIALATKPDLQGKTIEQWIQDLGNERFPIRNRASAMLVKLGPSTESSLREALPRARDVEMKRRIEELLTRLATRELTPQEILHWRAVEVLEAIATPEARGVLERWTKGDAAAELTEEARLALGRMR